MRAVMQLRTLRRAAVVAVWCSLLARPSSAQQRDTTTPPRDSLKVYTLPPAVVFVQPPGGAGAADLGLVDQVHGERDLADRRIGAGDGDDGGRQGVDLEAVAPAPPGGWTKPWSPSRACTRPTATISRSTSVSRFAASAPARSSRCAASRSSWMGFLRHFPTGRASSPIWSSARRTGSRCCVARRPPCSATRPAV